MPGRKYPLITDEIYHVFNRGIDHRPIFTNRRELDRALEIANFYQFVDPPVRLSMFLLWSIDRRESQLNRVKKSGERMVDIASFCFMPNHFHFLLRQKKSAGISKFMSLFQNSYTRYFNTRHQRDGSLLLGQFKAVRIETEDQLIHVSRYIHLNPFTSFVIKSLHELSGYRWSSLPQFLGLNKGFAQEKIVMDSFKDVLSYRKFVYNQAEYQRTLHKFKHLVLE